MLATDANQHLAEMQVRMQTPCMVYTISRPGEQGFCGGPGGTSVAAQSNGPGGMQNQSELMLAWPDA